MELAIPASTHNRIVTNRLRNDDFDRRTIARPPAVAEDGRCKLRMKTPAHVRPCVPQTQGICSRPPTLANAVPAGISAAAPGYLAVWKLRKYSYPPCTLVILTSHSPVVPLDLRPPLGDLPGDVSSPVLG